MGVSNYKRPLSDNHSFIVVGTGSLIVRWACTREKMGQAPGRLCVLTTRKGEIVPMGFGILQK